MRVADILIRTVISYGKIWGCDEEGGERRGEERRGEKEGQKYTQYEARGATRGNKSRELAIENSRTRRTCSLRELGSAPGTATPHPSYRESERFKYE